MTWISGTERQTLEIQAPLAATYAFFSTPALRGKALQDMKKQEVIDETTERWHLQTKKAKGVSLDPVYTIQFSGNGRDSVKWDTIGEGTTRSKGTALLKPMGPERTRVEYKEDIESDIPIPKIMARVFRPIVAHEIRKGVRSFLKNAKSILEAAH